MSRAKSEWSSSERQGFLSAAAQLLAPPTTKNGFQPSNADRPYRVGTFTQNTYLGIDANDDGTICTHIFTADVEMTRRLESLAADVTMGQLKKPQGLPASVARRGIKDPERFYFGFTWTAEDRGEGDLAHVRAAVGWLVSLRDRIAHADAHVLAGVTADPPVVNALSFSRALIRALPEDWTTGCPEEGAANWTGFMAKKLFEVATELGLGVCSTAGGGTPRQWHLATKETGHACEFLFDFTMYRDWGDFAQPTVILEHENVWHLNAFMEDLWKLMFGYAPLRVMIGYHRNTDRVGEYVAAIRKVAHERAWKYPAEVEDLVLIGHGQMTPRGFTVVHRRAGSRDWVEWADLGDFLRQEQGQA